MVWGVIFPPTFGAHSPEGNFDAFDTQLHKNFDALPEKRRELYVFPGEPRVLSPPAYVLDVYGKLTQGPSASWHGHTMSRPIEENEWPSEYALEKPRENLTAIIKVGFNILLVAEALKNIMERVDSGIHQFRPITITMPRGAVYPVQYYTMIIGQWLDSFVPEMSDPECYTFKMNSYYVKEHRKHEMAGLAFSSSRIGKSHLWKEMRLERPPLCISDKLYVEIITAGLRLPKHFQMKEV